MKCIIIGAGPAGLTAAYDLARAGHHSVTLEGDSAVGGLSKTVSYKGFLFDIGGHRFFTKVSAVERMWHEVLGSELLVRPRLSRIYYRHYFFDYPLKPTNVIAGLGLAETVRCGASYLRAKLFPANPEPDFATWVSNRFGTRLFDIFFRTYTEKVWGMQCDEISADWAAQRIQSLSFGKVVGNALRRHAPLAGDTPKSLIEQFLYPRCGPGQMWSKTAAFVEQQGSKVIRSAPAAQVLHSHGKVTGVQTTQVLHTGDHYISSMAIRDLIRSMQPPPRNALGRRPIVCGTVTTWPCASSAADRIYFQITGFTFHDSGRSRRPYTKLTETGVLRSCWRGKIGARVLLLRGTVVESG